MSRAVTRRIAPIAVAIFTAMSGCIGRTSSAPSIARGPAPADSIAAQLTELELQRISLRAAATPESASTRDIDARIASVHERMRKLPAAADVERTAAERLLLALDTHDAIVSSRLQVARLAYTDRFPPVRQAIAELQLLQQRRSEIQAELVRK